MLLLIPTYRLLNQKTTMSDLWGSGVFLLSSHMKTVILVSALKDWSGCILSLAYMLYSFNALITAQSHWNRTVHAFLHLAFQEYNDLPSWWRTVVQVLHRILRSQHRSFCRQNRCFAELTRSCYMCSTMNLTHFVRMSIAIFTIVLGALAIASCSNSTFSNCFLLITDCLLHFLNTTFSHAISKTAWGFSVPLIFSHVAPWKYLPFSGKLNYEFILT